MLISFEPLVAASGKSSTREFLTWFAGVAAILSALGLGLGCAEPTQAQSLPTGGAVASGSFSNSEGSLESFAPSMLSKRSLVFTPPLPENRRACRARRARGGRG